VGCPTQATTHKGPLPTQCSGEQPPTSIFDDPGVIHIISYDEHRVNIGLMENHGKNTVARAVVSVEKSALFEGGKNIIFSPAIQPTLKLTYNIQHWFLPAFEEVRRIKDGDNVEL